MRASNLKHQRGSIAIVVALTLTVMLGMIGLAVDGGRLYVNKSELQSAADACALAAAAELVCDASSSTCPSTYLANAEKAGIAAAARNNSDLQTGAVSIAAADVKFSTAISPNVNYLGKATANTGSRFVMCTARSAAIAPLLTQFVGASSSTITAQAVATMAPSQSFCSTAPIAVCKKSSGSYAYGEWISSAFTNTSTRGTSGGNNGNCGEKGNENCKGNGSTGSTTVPDSPENGYQNLTGNFRWADFTGNNGTDQIRDRLYGSESVCNVTMTSTLTLRGQRHGAAAAYNTRFGIYQGNSGSATFLTATPDLTGYAYPNKSPSSGSTIAIGADAYADYKSRVSTYKPFTPGEYADTITGTPTSSANLQTYGKQRRLISVPVVDCTASGSTAVTDMACVLMLNPMGSGVSGTVYLEYLGSAKSSASPCGVSGTPGGTTSTGPLVPTLVQ